MHTRLRYLLLSLFLWVACGICGVSVAETPGEQPAEPLETSAPDVGQYAVEDILEVPKTTRKKWTGVTVSIVEVTPRLTDIVQDRQYLLEDDTLRITFCANEAGSLTIQVFAYEDEQIVDTFSQTVHAGENVLQWSGEAQGARVLPGEYALVLTLDVLGTLSDPEYIFIAVDMPPDDTGDSTEPIAADDNISPPYSAVADGSYWAMTPGEVDDSVIWDILMQRITVYDDFEMHASGHVYLMSNPDGTGERVAQIHARSQGLHVLDKRANEHGYILVEAFSNYDPEYNPRTPEQKADAFAVKQGYVLAENLYTFSPEPDIGFVIDKLTQRMYMYMDGKRVSEFLISTGKHDEDTYYRETIAGEFITIGHVQGYWSGDLYSDYPIRFNGGTLLHEAPCLIDADGRKQYGIFERRLGSKHSSGCVRVQHWKNEEGYNMKWLYDNLKKSGRYKIIIWDDLNRYDTPTTWR